MSDVSQQQSRSELLVDGISFARERHRQLCERLEQQRAVAANVRDMIENSMRSEQHLRLQLTQQTDTGTALRTRLDRDKSKEEALYDQARKKSDKVAYYWTL